MALTPAQSATLRTAVLAEPSLANAVLTGDDYAIAAWCNAPTSWVVYKSVLSRHDILTKTSPTGTSFTWAGGAYITRAQGERDAFREMFNDTGTVNPGDPKIQSAFLDIFSGAGGAPNRTHILALSKRTATNAERVLSTGLGTDANPATLTFEGEVSQGEASMLR